MFSILGEIIGNRRVVLLIAVLASAPTAGAQIALPPLQETHARAWTADRRVELVSRVTSRLGAMGYVTTAGSWDFADVADCLARQQGTCWGTNPDTPYGNALFMTGDVQTNRWQMREDEAVVLIAETPPQVKYFSFVHYLYSRDEGGPERMVYYASLGDSLNDLKLGTAEAAPEQGANFSQLAAIVITADDVIYRQISGSLLALGYPAQGINVLPMPALLPLYMGRTPTSDVFTLLFRGGFPEDSEPYADWMARSPISVLLVSPRLPRQAHYLAAPGFTTPGSGIAEPTLVAEVLDQLAADVTAHYASEYELEPQHQAYKLDTGLDCIEQHRTCGGDNHDAIYARDLDQAMVPRSRKDMVVVVGYDHERAGKTAYTNHSIVDDERDAGIVSFGMSVTEGSVAYHAGITDPQDPRLALYDGYYAYVASYDCGDRPYCLRIPEPTPEDPVGVQFGQPFRFTARLYNDPLTAVRPELSEVVMHRVFKAYWRRPAP